jgi:hypothetical protein
MADQPNPDISLDKLAEVIKDAATAATSGVEYAEYLKTLRRTVKKTQDTLSQAKLEHLDNLRLIRDDAQVRLAAAEAVANVCSATKSRKTRKDKDTPRGPKKLAQVQQTLIPNDPVPAVQDEPQDELSDEPF